MQNVTATLQDSFAVSYKAKHICTIQSSIHVPRYYPTDLKIYLPHELCTNVYGSIFHNQYKLEANRKALIGEWMNKLW